jgi:hypothetical protein
MYLYSAQGKLEKFEANYGPLITQQVAQEKIAQETKIAQERIAQERKSSYIKGESLISSAVSQEKVSQEQMLLNAIQQQLNSKIVSPKVDVPCVIANANNKSEILSRCGKCCQNSNLILNSDYDKTKNICYCNKFDSVREKNKDIVYKPDYLQSTKTSSGVFKSDSKIISADNCKDFCLSDETCSYSFFNDKNKSCYLATANPIKGVKQERIDQIIDYKNIPDNVETLSSARYFASSDIMSKQQAKMTTYKQTSLPNCAQRCVNDTTCTFANANVNLDCDLWTIPIKFTTPQNDFSSTTIVPSLSQN